jgi:hypothetical protein
MICSLNVFIINNPDLNPNADLKLRLKPDPNPKKIISDPQHCVSKHRLSSCPKLNSSFAYTLETFPFECVFSFQSLRIKETVLLQLSVFTRVRPGVIFESRQKGMWIRQNDLDPEQISVKPYMVCDTGKLNMPLKTRIRNTKRYLHILVAFN